MSGHFWREVGRQLRETKGAGLVALLLLAVGGAWTLLFLSFLLWAQGGLQRSATTAVLVGVLREGAREERLISSLHQAFPQAHSDLLRGEKLAQAFSPWLGGGRWETLLPQLLEVHLPSQQAPRVQAWLAQQPEVLLVQSSSQWSRQALQALSQGLRLAAALAGVMALAFGVLVVLTVRALVLSHADEIAIMRLIGAHEGKIRGPYLMANALIGLVGGVGAVALSLGAQAALAQILPLPLPPSSFLLAVALAGPLLGALGALVGLRSLPPEP